MSRLFGVLIHLGRVFFRLIALLTMQSLFILIFITLQFGLDFAITQTNIVFINIFTDILYISIHIILANFLVIVFVYKYTLEIQFKWFDFWIGFYYDIEKGIIYFLPLPMCVFKFTPSVTFQFYDGVKS